MDEVILVCFLEKCVFAARAESKQMDLAIDRRDKTNTGVLHGACGRTSVQDDDFKGKGIEVYPFGFSLSRRGDPEGVRVEEEEENHAQGHEVHVDEEEDATVIEAPAALHAADGVCGAGGGGEGGENEERCGMDLGEAGEEDGYEQTCQDKQNGAEEGSLARIEKAGEHTVLIDWR